tara:strand:+ start:724 stop:963 length:240 start_codon:yes stop_codon:yes gene_type:complete
MHKIPLTPRQKDVYDFVSSFYERYKYMPTVKEIMEGKIDNKQVLESRGNGPVGQALKRIEERGWIERPEGGRARAIRLI